MTNTNKMKKLLAVLLWMVLLWGCRSKGMNTSEDEMLLHPKLGNAADVEPVSLVYVAGTYRMFYSSLEPSNITSSLHQTVSKDLIHWSDTAESVLPTLNNAILRGAIIIDSNNISGYGTGGSDLLVAVLTKSGIHDSLQASPILAFSNNGGDNWTIAKDTVSFPEAFLNNPQNTGIFWHAETKKWIMSLALKDHAEFYSSADLRIWILESAIGTDFFPEEVTWQRAALFSTGNGLHWVMLADIKKTAVSKTSGGTVYFIGDFDGHHFTNRSGELHWLDYGEDIYGTLVSVGADGRVINMGWRNTGNEQTGKPGSRVSEMITVARELQVEVTNTESFVSASPVKEMQSIYGKQTKIAATRVSYKVGEVPMISGVKTPIEVMLKFNTQDIQKGSFPKRLGVSFGNASGEEIRFGYDRFGFYYLDKPGISPGTVAPDQPLKMPYDHMDSTMNLRFILDGSTIECFSEGGKCVMTGTYSSTEPFDTIKLFAVNGDIDLLEGKIIELATTRSK